MLLWLAVRSGLRWLLLLLLQLLLLRLLRVLLLLPTLGDRTAVRVKLRLRRLLQLHRNRATISVQLRRVDLLLLLLRVSVLRNWSVRG